jgi:FkbM family methyltransferase
MRILTKGKFRFYTREDGAFDDAFCVNEIFNNDDTYRIRPEYFTGGVVVDLGANIGDFSVLVSEYAPVYCYEPEPHNWQMLCMNIELNKDVLNHPITPINKGVGKKGTFTIKNNSGHSQVLDDGGDFTCECIDLNEALAPFDSIDLLKFDIEGSEYDLFENATAETMKKIKRIVGELHSWRWADKERHDKLLTKLNKYFDIERWGYLDSTIAGSAHLILGASMIGGTEKEGQDLAIGIKTFMREDSLMRLIDSIDQYLPEYKIYIADDSDTGAKEARYEALEAESHKIIRLAFDVGLSTGRNALMDEIEEEFVLYCDDDFIFDSDNGVSKVLEVMKKRPDIGMITGMVKCGGNETTFNLNEKNWEEVDGIKLRQTDRGLNFFIARTAIFKNCKWNPKYKINQEHEDFFKRLKEKTKIYYCPTLQVNHEGRTASGEYAKYRNRSFK